MRNFIKEIISLLKGIEQSIENKEASIDYKTDIYMDGDNRVIVERLSDGSTVILDEHENPIIKRTRQGVTEFYDAYQSLRIEIDAHGNLYLNNPSGDIQINGEIYIKGIGGFTGANASSAKSLRQVFEQIL